MLTMKRVRTCFRNECVVEGRMPGSGSQFLCAPAPRPFKGMLNGCGGKLDPGEAPLIGAAREIVEETELDIPVEKIAKTLTSTPALRKARD